MTAFVAERPDPEKTYLEKLLKIPPAGTPAAAVQKETDAIADIRKRNEVRYVSGKHVGVVFILHRLRTS